MADEKRSGINHSIVMERRENISITGVNDVISFDEETIIVDTEMGVLILRGNGLHVSKLNLENGLLEVDGEIFNLTYEEEGSGGRGKSSILGKLFR